MIFKAFLNQGQGCDYTIGCGKTVIDIQADSVDEAKDKLSEIISTRHIHDETKIETAELYVIQQVIEMNVQYIYEQREELLKTERNKKQEEQEKKEFERLQKKYGSK